MDEWVKEVGESECRSVMDWIGVRTLPHPDRGLTSDWSWITKKVRKGSTAMVTLADVCFGTIEGLVGALRQLSTSSYREGGWMLRRRVLYGALSRLEPGAGKLARRVLRGGVGRKARPLPDCPGADMTAQRRRNRP
jgi:hypothetical protein